MRYFVPLTWLRGACGSTELRQRGFTLLQENLYLGYSGSAGKAFRVELPYLCEAHHFYSLRDWTPRHFRHCHQKLKINWLQRTALSLRVLPELILDLFLVAAPPKKSCPVSGHP
jgi:hypothetical protein